MTDMSYSDFIYIADLIGVAVFATAGALAAQGKRLDILGVVVLAIVTALGGGTIRDITLDIHPVVWIADTSYLWTAIISAVVAFVVCRYIQYPRRTLLVLDAMGLALFAVLGAEKALALDLPPLIVVMMAVITGCAGGMIRDILTGQIPLILQRDGELYATCALVGAIIYVSLQQYMPDMPGQIVALTSMTIIFVLRMAAMFTDLRLPEFIIAGHKLEKIEKRKE
ncbi:trimeric intracellular cation channel family protein [Neptuniibacter sp.]|uniref:trimeric intracellular cation channel family protein n=1 Tax=Neptuniibacter sp. TaxID=1962643 RepID=UPI0026321BBE|nr:trimeric intracellular cation channel family protein [Neptuniibacter sp.]MCP4598580.1 trimeric intracellular cation channel family protein [Neptuniibacter sp.]